MRSPKTIAIVAGALVVAVALFVIFSENDEATPEAQTTVATTTNGAETTGQVVKPKPSPSPVEPEVAVITITNGRPVGGVQELEFKSGGMIRFIVESDVDEEVHLHGYDVAQEVSAGGSTKFEVPADIEGVFEAELEHSAVPIAEISVVP